MTFSFSPGKPTLSPQAVTQCRWKQHHILAYTSGNNLIILTNSSLDNMQTMYLDSDATAVSINEQYGYIAVCVGSQVVIYEPEFQFMKVPRWKFLTRLDDEYLLEIERQYRLKEEEHEAAKRRGGDVKDLEKVNFPKRDSSVKRTVCWSLQDELLVGSDCLTIWKITKQYNQLETHILWREPQHSPVYYADISQDSDYIASCGYYDTILKIRPKTSSTAEELKYGLILYRVPSFITNLRFKKSEIPDPENKHDFLNVIYLVSADKELRFINCGINPTNAQIDAWLKGSIKLSENNEEGTFVNVIDEYLVKEALLNISKKVYKAELQELQRLHMDLVLIGNSSSKELSVYSIENLSVNAANYNMADINKLNNFQSINTPKVPVFTDTIVDDSGSLSTISHDLSSSVIENITLDLSFLLSPPSNDKHQLGTLTHTITGHVKSIQALIRTSDGSALLTTSRFQENAVWVTKVLENGVTALEKKSVVESPHPIARAVLLEKGNILVTVCKKDVIVWDTSKAIAKELYCYEIDVQDVPLCFTALASSSHCGHDTHYLIAVYSDHTKAFIVTSTEIKHIEIENIHDLSPSIFRIAAIDPVSSTITNRHRPIISTIDESGVVRCFTASVSGSRSGTTKDTTLSNGRTNLQSIKFTQTHKVDTQINNATYIRGSSISKVAIAQVQTLTIWDLNTGLKEYTETFQTEIKDIDWSGTPFGQSILAVGFTQHCLLYTQLRYDYTNANPSYLAIKKIDISKFTTHSIGDSVWLDDATFVIGSGNQLFVNDKSLDLVNDSFTKHSIGSRNIGGDDSILGLCAVLNGPVPLYHPQILIQALFQGKVELVKEILLRLFLNIRDIEMKSIHITEIDSSLGFDITKFWISEYKPSHDFPEPYNEFNVDVAELLKDKLSMKHSLPFLTRHQQITLINTIEAVLLINQNKLELDANGLKFFLALKLAQLSHHQHGKRLSFRDISWALHSENKELLLFIIRSSGLKAGENNINWATAVKYGLSHWVRYEDLMALFEEIAKSEYSSNPEDRDPTKCAIFYLALKKKQILMALWKTSYSHPEQQKMMSFLKNDFKQERWRKAALKNSFVLLSKHRFMDAACFFLLADSLKDAVNVLIRQINDWDLAVGVCRVYEGDNGPVLTSILQTHFLEKAVLLGDRWLASYVFWKSRNYERAIQSLIKAPAEGLTEEEKQTINITPGEEESEHGRSKSFLEDDPLLIVLYERLREKNEAYFKGTLAIEPQLERDFLVRVARIYTRMGCDYLALDLVRNWKFISNDQVSKRSLSSFGFNGTTSSFAKFGFSPKLQRRSSILETYNTSSTPPSFASSNSTSSNGGSTRRLSILEKYGLASKPSPSVAKPQVIAKSEESAKEEEDYKKKVKEGNFTAPPSSAFEEPDMSSFNFGF